MRGARSALVGAGSWVVFTVAVAGALAAVVVRPSAAGDAASQVWPPFVLVAGLLLVGLVAEGDGLFAAAGHRLARLAPNAVALFAGAVILLALVTAVLNLDTSVVFLTPVLVYAARRRGYDEAAFLYAALLLSNAGSLLLPGSNLTNLIVLGHHRVSGARFAGTMAPAWVAAVVVTAAVVAVMERQSLRGAAAVAGHISGDSDRDSDRDPDGDPDRDRLRLGLGLAAVVLVAVFVLVLPWPALPVAAVGLAAVGIRLAGHRESWARATGVLGARMLVGLFAVAVALGTLGRSWSGPATALSHLDGWTTAAVAAAASVVFNNLPAASLLASRVPARPYALLVGLDIGPNLCVTGSLAWFLWRRAARSVGARPSLRRASLLGLLSVPAAVAAAVATLALAGRS